MDDIILVDFIKLSFDEKKMVLDWRNHVSVRRWMYNKDLIEFENHLKFINGLENNNSKKYFLIKKDNKNIGVIDFTNINRESVDMGLYSNPEVKGLGNILINTIIYYAFQKLNVKKIYAEVFEINQRAIDLYKRHGFVKIDTKTVHGEDVIRMELIKDNVKDLLCVK